MIRLGALLLVFLAAACKTDDRAVQEVAKELEEERERRRAAGEEAEAREERARQRIERRHEEVRAARQRAREAGVVLVVESRQFSSAYGRVIAEGRVTNVTDAPLADVQAYLEFRKPDGSTLRSESFFVDTNPLPPGKVSRFRVATRRDPHRRVTVEEREGGEARIRFERFGGGPLRAWPRKRYDGEEEAPQ